MVSVETLLSYSNWKIPFIVHTVILLVITTNPLPSYQEDLASHNVTTLLPRRNFLWFWNASSNSVEFYLAMK